MADMQDASHRVHVSTLEREPLLWSETGSGDKDRQGAPLGWELLRETLKLLPRAEGCCEETQLRVSRGVPLAAPDLTLPRCSR